jgi:hypothetical protein
MDESSRVSFAFLQRRIGFIRRRLGFGALRFA